VKVRYGLAVLAGIVLVVVITVCPYIGMPWGGDDVREAEATPADYGICNVSLSNLPEGVRAAPVPLPHPSVTSNNPTDQVLYLMLSIRVPPNVPNPTGVQSRVYINAATGEVTFEHYRTPEDESLLGESLASLHVGPWQPTGNAWPRTNTAPANDVRDLGSPRFKIRYRSPDTSAGLMVGFRSGDTLSRLSAYTCDSIVEIDGKTGEVLRQEVVPQEQAMFDRFLGDVYVGPPITARKGVSPP
jgi:hypothetical protein